jgi:AraC-like DNA-binding protein
MGKSSVSVPTVLNAVSQRTATGGFAQLSSRTITRTDRLFDFEATGLVKRFGDIDGEEVWKRVAEGLLRKVAQRTRELHATKIALERALEQIRELKGTLRLENTAMRKNVSITRGGLAPWQAQRAKALMNANLDGKLPLSQLAEECGLSTRHFARAFRQSTGVPPHRWLLARRVERAKDLLHDAALSLAEVALACGFADQSHFTRIFTSVAGLSPGVWRRIQSGKPPLDTAGKDVKALGGELQGSSPRASAVVAA